MALLEDICFVYRITGNIEFLRHNIIRKNYNYEYYEHSVFEAYLTAIENFVKSNDDPESFMRMDIFGGSLVAKTIRAFLEANFYAINLVIAIELPNIIAKLQQQMTNFWNNLTPVWSMIDRINAKLMRASILKLLKELAINYDLSVVHAVRLQGVVDDESLRRIPRYIKMILAVVGVATAASEPAENVKDGIGRFLDSASINDASKGNSSPAETTLQSLIIAYGGENDRAVKEFIIDRLQRILLADFAGLDKVSGDLLDILFKINNYLKIEDEDHRRVLGTDIRRSAFPAEAVRFQEWFRSPYKESVTCKDKCAQLIRESFIRMLGLSASSPAFQEKDINAILTLLNHVVKNKGEFNDYDKFIKIIIKSVIDILAKGSSDLGEDVLDNKGYFYKRCLELYLSLPLSERELMLNIMAPLKSSPVTVKKYNTFSLRHFSGFFWPNTIGNGHETKHNSFPGDSAETTSKLQSEFERAKFEDAFESLCLLRKLKELRLLSCYYSQGNDTYNLNLDFSKLDNVSIDIQNRLCQVIGQNEFDHIDLHNMQSATAHPALMNSIANATRDLRIIGFGGDQLRIISVRLRKFTLVNSSVSDLSIFSGELRSLNISDCNKLEHVGLNSDMRLKEIVIDGCSKLDELKLHEVVVKNLDASGKVTLSNMNYTDMVLKNKFPQLIGIRYGISALFYENLERLLSNDPTLTVLELRKIDISDPVLIKALRSNLINNPRVTGIVLESVMLCKDSMNMLVELCKKNPDLILQPKSCVFNGITEEEFHNSIVQSETFRKDEAMDLPRFSHG